MSERAQALEHLNAYLDAIDEIATIGAAPKEHTGQAVMGPPYHMTITTAKNIKWNTREIRSKLALLAIEAPAEGVSPPPAPVSPVEPTICICPACLGSGGPCDLCEGTGDVQDLPARRLSPVEPTPEPPRWDADYTDPRLWASGAPDKCLLCGEGLDAHLRLDAACRMFSLPTGAPANHYDACERARAERDAAQQEAQTLRAALTRLRDCDWAIGRGDRMDAVRDIARDALAPRPREPQL